MSPAAPAGWIRLMHENALLPPQRAHRRDKKCHGRQIITSAVRASGLPSARHGRPPAVQPPPPRRRPGFALRQDHRSNFVAANFLMQVKFWSNSPSYASVGEPEASGVIERLYRPGRSRPSTKTSSRPSTTSRASCRAPTALRIM